VRGRTDHDRTALKAEMPNLLLAHELILAIDKDQPVSKIRTMDQVIEASIAAPRFWTLLLGLFGFQAHH
jgi:hypothetical protein